MVTARRTKRTAAGERWWTIDFNLREEDIQMTGITIRRQGTWEQCRWSEKGSDVDR